MMNKATLSLVAFFHTKKLYFPLPVDRARTNLWYFWGMLDRSTARYFYKRLRTSLHKPRGNLLENLFFFKCALQK